MKRKIVMFLLISIMCTVSIMQGSAFAASTPQFQLTSDKLELKAGEIVTLTMNGKKLNDMYAYEAKFTYDPAKLELTEAKSQLKGFSVAPIKKDKEITIAHTKVGNSAGENGDVLIGTLTFKAKESGIAVVNWNAMKVVNSQLQDNSYVVNETTSLNISETIVNPVSFTDIKGHWAEASIIEAASKGLINGYPGGKFLPNGSITRTEFAVMLSRSLKLEAQDELKFIDAGKIPNWAKSDVAKVVTAGFIQGYQDNSFRGDQPITRAEIAVMVARSLNLKATDGEKLTFVDSNSIPSWAKGWVELAVDKGIMQGSSGNKFLPNDNATRAEATVMILRLLSLDK
ncbi:S-layer homology domain-containing protein [Paenibacillus endoradicis]|uniref:S-layer homology domain-containing protein n=1 Tax=Paenibacillus endoradicis TaxID=2972487 RepID=UPI00215946DB|nr:S-layer homology domain-containing protein [Paenibacillus endoradicis]MCR8660414.1 S-layer homology domain-containing protein [Paenibacillus endoradicis]